MDIRPIRNQRDHVQVLQEVGRLWGARSGTPEAARVSEVLNRKRSLTVAMIVRLRDKLGISADVLIGPQRRAA